jgi:glutathione synthase/RimK-type ligase-like ATP-grasp enzyme
MNNDIHQALGRARALAARGEDDGAKNAYVQVLRLAPSHFAALNELGALASASGHRSAARTAYMQMVRYHPDNPVGHINLGNQLFEDGDASAARAHYQAALDLHPGFPEAHQGLARVMSASGEAGVDDHWRKGFDGHAVVTKPYRGTSRAIPVLLLVSAYGGNVRTQQWINDRQFAVAAIFAEFYDAARPLPAHDLVVNAIGDAELCAEAIVRAQEIVAATSAPVINAPELVAATGRVDNARRLASVPGVIAPAMVSLSREAILEAGDLNFPLLLRSPGFHTGQHFLYVEDREALAAAVNTLPGEDVLAIEYLDARGPDGMARKYRVMFIDGVLYPLHLAVSADWKVHYFTAAMATNEIYRHEERRFLEDMPAVLGQRAVAALEGISATLGLEYAGVDFALTPQGAVLLFEANATMVILQPDPDPVWDYRRRAVTAVSEAVTRMLWRRLGFATTID